MNKILCTLLIALFAIGLTDAQTSCAAGTEQVELVNNALSNGEFPLVGESLFFDDFGESDIDNGNVGRTESPYMPSNGFVFGDSHLLLPEPGGEPWHDNPIRNAARINDGFYAVVAPAYINDGWFIDDGWGSWWTGGWNSSNPIYDYFGTENGAALVINAGENLTPFYEREALIQGGATYRASFKLFVVQATVQVGIDIIDPVTQNVLYTMQTIEYVNDYNENNIDEWQDVVIDFTMPGTCSAKEVVVSYRNHFALVDGNDFYVDNIRLEKIVDAPACSPVEDCVSNGKTSVNLNDAYVGSIPDGASLVWFTTSDHSGGRVSDPENVTDSGNYYAFFYDADNDCYNTNNSTSVVQVFIIEACPSADLSVVKTVNNETPNIEDNIIFTLTAENLGPYDATNVEVTDQLPTGYTFVSATPSVGRYDDSTGIWTIGNLANGATATLEMEVKVTTTGEYTNTATITGDQEDPNPENNTSTLTPEPIYCTEEVEGEAFEWTNADTADNPITKTMTQPGTNGGFQFDIYELDNSFNMEINGVKLAEYEIEFQSDSTPDPGINIEFEDGDQYEADTDGAIWQMLGNSDNPLIRVKISPTGSVTMFGSKTSGGALYPLRFKQNISPINSFNTIQWNTTSDNTIIVTQNVVGQTKMDGYGSGRNIIPCCTEGPTYGDVEPNTYVGISTLDRNIDGSWATNAQNGFIKLESETLGFVPTRLTTEQRNQLTPEEGMMIWNITNQCLEFYNGTTWVCGQNKCNR